MRSDPSHPSSEVDVRDRFFASALWQFSQNRFAATSLREGLRGRPDDQANDVFGDSEMNRDASLTRVCRRLGA